MSEYNTENIQKNLNLQLKYPYISYRTGTANLNLKENLLKNLKISKSLLLSYSSYTHILILDLDYIIYIIVL